MIKTNHSLKTGNFERSPGYIFKKVETGKKSENGVEGWK